MFCPKCGTQNNDGAAFCKGCGARFRQDGSHAPAHVAPTGQVARGAAGGAAAVAKRPIGKKPLIIAIAAIIVVAIAIVAWLVFGPKDCYVMSRQTSSSPMYSTTWTRTENGVVLKTEVDVYMGDAILTEYKELVDGISIPKDAVGSYQMNSDGFVSSYEYTDPSTGTKFSTSYEYYRPGIIKTVIQRTLIGTDTLTFNEEGWLIARTMAPDTSSGNQSGDYSVDYEYEFANGNKTAKVHARSADSSATETATIGLDDHGYPISMQGADGELTQTWTWEKVTSPPKMVAAEARLKRF